MKTTKTSTGESEKTPYCRIFDSNKSCPGTPCEFIHSEAHRELVKGMYSLTLYRVNLEGVLCPLKDKKQAFLDNLRSKHICFDFYVLNKCKFNDKCYFNHVSQKGQKDLLDPLIPDELPKKSPKPSKNLRQETENEETKKEETKEVVEIKKKKHQEKKENVTTICEKCNNKKASCVYQPCGHKIHCHKCAKTMLSNLKDKCGFCFKKVESVEEL